MHSIAKWKSIALCGWLFAVVLAGIEGLRYMQFKSGGGSGSDSPDGTSTAYLESYRTDGPLVRDTNVWLAVYLQPEPGPGAPDSHFLRFLCNSPGISDEMYARENEAALSWSPDSKTVRVRLPGTEITITK